MKEQSSMKHIIYCNACGWVSEQKDSLADFGVPWYCDECGKQTQYYVSFEPHESATAYLIARQAYNCERARKK